MPAAFDRSFLTSGNGHSPARGYQIVSTQPSKLVRPREVATGEPNGPFGKLERAEAPWVPEILDTSPDDYFERLIRMAKRLFGVPIAFVSFASDGPQGFASQIGLSGIDKLQPGKTSFCSSDIVGDEIFIVANAAEDDRFASDPLVLGEPHIRFYAGCPLRSVDGRRLGTLCIIDRRPRDLGQDDLDALADLASMAERELATLQLATLDDLTNVSNRRGFMLLARHSLNLCTRQRIPAALVFMDLDGFKSINDAFGHAEGDCALKVFAKLMGRACRESDLFARLGGDEFVALLVNTSDKVAEEVVGRFARFLNRHNRLANRGYDISFSYGIVGFDSEKHRTLEELLAAGDELMYAIKNGKK